MGVMFEFELGAVYAVPIFTPGGRVQPRRNGSSVQPANFHEHQPTHCQLNQPGLNALKSIRKYIYRLNLNRFADCLSNSK